MKRHFPAMSPIAAIAMALGLLGAANVPVLPVPKDAVVIYNPGNDEYVGFRIVVEPNGRAAAVDAAGRAADILQSDVTGRLFSDLAAASAARLPSHACGDQPNLSTTTVAVNAAVVITWRGRHLEGLDCASDPRALRVLSDATAIARAMYVQAYRERTITMYGVGRTYNASSGSRSYLPAYSPPTGYGTTTGGYNGGLTMGNPYAGAPPGSRPSGSLPGSGIQGSLPSGSLPWSSPFGATPYGGGPSTGSPYGASPYGGSL